MNFSFFIIFLFLHPSTFTFASSLNPSWTTTKQQMASASDLQEQELSFYQGNIHSLIAPENSISLILHEPANYPSWLISGIIQQSISSNNECYLSQQSPAYPKTPSSTFFYSFSETEQTYSKYFLKYITQNKSLFQFISPLTDSTISIESWNKSIITKVKETKTKDLTPVVILESPELLLSIIPGLTIPKLLTQIMEIQKYATLYIALSTDLINSSELVISLLHRSSIILSLTSLTTGRADDISGVLSISKGPIHNEDINKKLVSFKIADRQFVYFVSANGVKLYYK